MVEWMGTFFDKADAFVKKSFAGDETQIRHFERTVYWMRKLNPKADEASFIAAMAHDIERAFRTKEQHKKRAIVGYDHPAFFRPHEEKGAEIMGGFLKKEGAPREMIEKVKMLISRHEEGGNEEQNFLKDADSVSFLENNIPLFLEKAQKERKEKIRAKFEWMFERITSEKAKKIARPWYEKAMRGIRKVKEGN